MSETIEAAATKRAKTKTQFDPAKYTVTIHEPGADPVHYDLGALPDTMKTQLAAKGAAAYLTNANDGHAAAYARLQAGDYSARKAAEPKALNPWRLAIAHAAVDETKKTDTPLSLDDAKAKAVALPADQVLARKTHPTVLKHYHKITGTTPVASVL